MPESYFPLRWESTGDQWWYASPIDLAAANGHYDLVRELLYLDTNLLIKLTSLCRIRRLETVWDDEEQFQDVSKNRSHVAQKLFLECENKKGLNNNNSLIRAGYGGWLLYTAASAGDIDFVKRLLERDPLLVFGEGDYGVTDILYGAARSKNYEVFKLILDSAISGKCNLDEIDPVFKWDMMNRAVHAAARGGDVKILKEILGNCDDVLVYRDAQGSTLLHSASGRGQIEVVKFLLDSYDIINTLDQQGNTALHIAAYRGYSSVLQILIDASPSTALLVNNFGDTFLHMAVAGFRSPGFRRLDRLVDLVKNLVNGEIMVMEDIINAKNNDGRTALHLAVTDNVQSELVELLLSARSIDLNSRDLDGNTPLDLLRRRPKSALSEILIKEMISAGGISNCQDYITRSALVSQLKLQVIGNSPGTSFRIPDGEIFLYTGIKGRYDGYASTDYDNFSGEISYCGSSIGSEKQKGGRLSSVSRRLKMLLRFASRKEKEEKTNIMEDFEDRITPYKSVGKTPIPLRQRFSNNNKRVLELDIPIPDYPTPDDKRRFGAGLMQGVMRVKRQLYFGSPSSTLSESSMSSPKSVDNKEKGFNNNNTGIFGSILSPNKNNRMKSLNRDHGSGLINQYLCIGAQGLACGDDPNTIVASQVANNTPTVS